MYREWNALLARAKAGDQESKLEILNRLRPLIIKSIKSYYNRRDFYEELIHEGECCILEAIDKYDRGKNTYFLGYAKTQLMYLYIVKGKAKIHISLNTPVGEEKQGEMIDLLASDEASALEQMIQRETLRDLIASLDYLSARQRRVVELFYIDRKTIGEIAEDLDVKYRTVVNTKTRAIEILKKRWLGFKTINRCKFQNTPCISPLFIIK